MDYLTNIVLWVGICLLLCIGPTSTGPIASTTQKQHVTPVHSSASKNVKELDSGPNQTDHQNVQATDTDKKMLGKLTGPENTMDMGMKMYFHIGNNEVILFKGWRTQSWAGMFLSCIFFIILAVIMEGVRVWRNSIKLKLGLTSEHLPTSAKVGDPETRSNALLLQAPVACMREALKNKTHIAESLVHVFHVALAFFLMLAAMTYNLWIFISLCLGAGLGHYLFAWRRAEIDAMEGICH